MRPGLIASCWAALGLRQVTGYPVACVEQPCDAILAWVLAAAQSLDPEEHD